MTALLIWLVCILVCAFIVYKVVIPQEQPKKSALQEMLATKEGREELAARIQASYPESRGMQVKACPRCEGYGKLGHHSAIWEGGLTEFTSNEICPDCGGTGLEGGTDYVNVRCIVCNGYGAILAEGATKGARCGVCQGTGIVKVNKGEL